MEETLRIQNKLTEMKKYRSSSIFSVSSVCIMAPAFFVGLSTNPQPLLFLG